MIYYHDRQTDTVRRYLNDATQEGERFNKETKQWTTDGCCQQSGCRWDEELPETDAEMIVRRQSK